MNWNSHTSKYENDSKILSIGRDRVKEKYPWFSAGWFWKTKSINKKISDNKGKSDAEVVEKVTKIITGGSPKLKERQNAFKRIKKLL